MDYALAVWVEVVVRVKNHTVTLTHSRSTTMKIKTNVKSGKGVDEVKH